MTDETALREAAEAATPGPWKADGLLQISQTSEDPIIICEVTGVRSAEQPQRDASFIALANPAAILALFDTIAAEKAARERAEKERDEARRNMLPVSNDGNYVFIDGPGDVDIDHGGELRKRAESAEAALAAAQADVARLRDARAALAARQWQPIETARKDGEPRLLRMPPTEYSPGWVSVGWWRKDKDFWCALDSQGMRAVDPDRWLPMLTQETPHD